MDSVGVSKLAMKVAVAMILAEVLSLFVYKDCFSLGDLIVLQHFNQSQFNNPLNLLARLQSTQQPHIFNPLFVYTAFFNRDGIARE